MEPGLECRVMAPCFKASGLPGWGEQATLSRGVGHRKVLWRPWQLDPLLRWCPSGQPRAGRLFLEARGQTKGAGYAPLGHKEVGAWGALLCWPHAPFARCAPACRRHALTTVPAHQRSRSRPHSGSDRQASRRARPSHPTPRESGEASGWWCMGCGPIGCKPNPRGRESKGRMAGEHSAREVWSLGIGRGLGRGGGQGRPWGQRLGGPTGWC